MAAVAVQIRSKSVDDRIGRLARQRAGRLEIFVRKGNLVRCKSKVSRATTFGELMSLEHRIIKMKARESEWGKNRTGDDW